MARTVRDIPVYGRNEADLVNNLVQWTRLRGASVVSGPVPDPRGTRLDFELGAGIFQLKRRVEVTVQPIQGGHNVHTEGYVKEMLSGELDLSPNAMNLALPRRDGWKEMNDLWNWIAQMSAGGMLAPSAPAPAAPAAAPMSAAPTAPVVPPPPPDYAPPQSEGAAPAPAPNRFCTRCGTPTVPGASFCGKCGARLGA